MKKYPWVVGLGMVAGGIVAWQWMRRRQVVALEDKVVIVTGASSGIGRATALAFARQGARVVLAARRLERLTELQAEIAGGGGEAIVVPTDVSREESLQTLVERTLSEFGRTDVLINNAGIADGGPFQELAPQRIQQQLQVNLYGPLRLTQLVLPAMLRQGAGHIVNISSGTALTPWPGLAMYVTTRAGLAGFTHALRRELAGTGVHVSLILPVWTRTELITPTVASRLRRYGFVIDSAEKPADAIVAAVRYRRAITTLGGPVEKLGIFVEARASWLMDWIWKLVVPRDFMDVMRLESPPTH